MEKITYEIPSEGKIKEVGSSDVNDYYEKITMKTDVDSNGIVDFKNNYRQNVSTSKAFRDNQDKYSILKFSLLNKMPIEMYDKIFDDSNSIEYKNLIKFVAKEAMDEHWVYLIEMLIMFNKTDMKLKEILNNIKYEKKYDYVFIMFGSNGYKETIPQFIIDLINQEKSVFVMVFGAFTGNSVGTVGEIFNEPFILWDYLSKNNVLSKYDNIIYNEQEIIISSHNRRRAIGTSVIPNKNKNYFFYITNYYFPVDDYKFLINKSSSSNTSYPEPYDYKITENKTDYSLSEPILLEPIIKIDDLDKEADIKTIQSKLNIIDNLKKSIFTHKINKKVTEYLNNIFYKTVDYVKKDSGKKILQVGIFPMTNELIIAQNFNYFDYFTCSYHNEIHMYLKNGSNLWLYKKKVFGQFYIIFNSFKKLLEDFNESNFINVNNLLEINDIIIEFEPLYNTIVSDSSKEKLIVDKKNNLNYHYNLLSDYLRKYLSYKSKYMKLKKLLN
jgi:hypothetical protein